MEIIRIPAGVYAANCYIVYDENKEAVVMDPGGDVDDIVAKIRELDLSVKYILLTHGHGDHIGGVTELKDYTNAEVYINEADEYMTKDSLLNLSMTMPAGPKEIEIDGSFKEGDTFEFGRDIRIEAIDTPGHTPGGTSFKIGDNLFTGDTLFAGSIGRTDFPKSSYEEILHSVNEKLMKFPDDTVVYPGHGPATNIKTEKRINPFVKK